MENKIPKTTTATTNVSFPFHSLQKKPKEKLLHSFPSNAQPENIFI